MSEETVKWRIVRVVGSERTVLREFEDVEDVPSTPWHLSYIFTSDENAYPYRSDSWIKLERI